MENIEVISEDGKRKIIDAKEMRLEYKKGKYTLTIMKGR